MDELLTMSNREINRLEAIQRIQDKRLTQKEAARLLSLSVRQIKRLCRAYKARGAKGLISDRRGKPSNHRLQAETIPKVIDLIYERYRAADLECGQCPHLEFDGVPSVIKISQGDLTSP